MTAWVIPIAPEYPEHLQAAFDDGFWDTRRAAGIEPGDEVFFWQSGGEGVESELKAMVVATSPAVEIEVDFTRAHWTDRLKGGYTHRFTFEPKAAEPIAKTRWAEVQHAAGRPLRLWPITRLDSHPAIVFLDSRFAIKWSGVDLAFGGGPIPDIADKSDRRARSMRSVVARAGQGRFRNDLLWAYHRKCAFTGYSAEFTLEAAHIFPYRGDQSNHVTNGILLRADLHSLFDAYLIAVDRHYRIRVAPELIDEGYRDLDRKLMALPGADDAKPSQKALLDHWRDCDFVKVREF